MTPASLRADLISAILRSKPCSDIGFWAAGTSIMGYHYGYIAELIDKGAVRTQPYAKRGYGGQYDPNDQTLYLNGATYTGYYASAGGRATIVHECTHAIFHLLKSGQIVRLADDEFIAWLAETIYRMNAGYDVIGSADNAPKFRKSLFFVAQKCINQRGDICQVDPRAVHDVGTELFAAAEKEEGKRLPSSQVMPGFDQTPPRPPGPPMEPDPDP
jgi:hypothetical protein